MKNKRINEALTESLIELGMSPKQLYTQVPQKISLLEYLVSNTNLSLTEAAIICVDLVDFDSYDSVTIQEADGYFNRAGKYFGNSLLANLGQNVGSAIGNKIRSTAQSAFNPNSGNFQAAAGNTNNPITAAQDFLGTKSSILRNSPLIRVTDSKTNTSKYFAFPDLDVTRPGHMQVLNAIIAKEQGEGKTVENIPVNHEARLAAAKAGNVTQIQFNRTDETNKKSALQNILNQIQQFITTTNTGLKKYAFISQDEVSGIQNSINSMFTKAQQALNQVQTETGDEIKTAVQQMDQTPSQQTVQGQTSQNAPNTGNALTNTIQQAASASATPGTTDQTSQNTKNIPQNTNTSGSPNMPQALVQPGQSNTETNTQNINTGQEPAPAKISVTPGQTQTSPLRPPIQQGLGVQNSGNPSTQETTIGYNPQANPEAPMAPKKATNTFNTSYSG